MSKRALLLCALLAVVLVGCRFDPDKGEIPEEHWKLFWMEMDLAVCSFILCWLTLGFSRYVSNRLQLTWGKPGKKKPEPSDVEKGEEEKPKDEGPLFEGAAGEGEKATEAEPETGEGEKGRGEKKKKRAKKPEKKIVKQPIPTALLIAVFVAIVFFGLVLAIDHVMSYQLAKGTRPVKIVADEPLPPEETAGPVFDKYEPVEIPHAKTHPGDFLFHLWGPAIAFKYHMYHAFFINTVALFNLQDCLDRMFANRPRLQAFLFWPYLGYLLSYLCFFIPAYVGARRTRTLWLFPLLIFALNVVLTIIALSLGWLEDVSELFNRVRETVRDLPVDLP